MEVSPEKRILRWRSSCPGLLLIDLDEVCKENDGASVLGRIDANLLKFVYGDGYRHRGELYARKRKYRAGFSVQATLKQDLRGVGGRSEVFDCARIAGALDVHPRCHSYCREARKSGCCGVYVVVVRRIHRAEVEESLRELWCG